MNDALLLCYRGEPLRLFDLGGASIEVGRGPCCDIVVHDPDCADRELLVRRTGGTVVAYDLKSGTAGDRRVLAAGEPVRVGRYHSLVRVVDSPRSVAAGARTDLIEGAEPPPLRLSLLVGSGPDARRLALGERPLGIGSAPANDLVLPDRAVSGRHCRLDPAEGGFVLRDLGSRNGTWLDGVRIDKARVRPGSRLRVGRTDLCILRDGGAPDSGLVAASPAMLEVLASVERFAPLGWPVLVHGESGAGKEGIARALHARSARSRGPLVALNAGGLPRELVESELFGHERGAFTGATGVHRGVFEMADGGTLFLDEIGELPLALQARLLRVLEDGEVRRVGGEVPIRVSARLVCATNRDLRAMAGEGTFRRDLYYRLARLVVDVPPLRERPDDVAALARHFLDQIAADVGPRELSPEAVARLLAHPWPGNARELRNVLSAAAAASPSAELSADDVARAIERLSGHPPPPPRRAPPPALVALVDKHQGNLSAAARALGVPRSTLRDRLKGPTKADRRRPPSLDDTG